MGKDGRRWEGDGEAGRDAGPKVSKTTPTHHTTSLPTPNPLGYRSRGLCNTTEPPSNSCSPYADRNRAAMAQFSSFFRSQPLALECALALSNGRPNHHRHPVLHVPLTLSIPPHHFFQ